MYILYRHKNILKEGGRNRKIKEQNIFSVSIQDDLCKAWSDPWTCLWPLWYDKRVSMKESTIAP